MFIQAYSVMRFTRPSNSGLITGLFVVFAPLADRLSPVQWTGAFAIFTALIVGEVLPVLLRKKRGPAR